MSSLRRSKPNHKMEHVKPKPLLAVAMLLVACGETGTEPSDTPGNGSVPAALEVVSGQTQTAIVGSELPKPLVVRVLDASNSPIAGQIVNFRVVAGGGSVFTGAGITNESGLAQERWTLGISAADSQRVEARALDNLTGEALDVAIFEARALPGPANGLTITKGDGQTGIVTTTLADSLEVTASDTFGNPVSGLLVSFSPSGGTVDPAAVSTDASGKARTSYTVPAQPGQYDITASANGLLPVTFTVPAIPAPLAATPIATFDNASQGIFTRLERRPDGGLLSATWMRIEPGADTVEFLAIELDGTVSVFGKVPAAGKGNVCCVDFDFGPDDALYGSLSNDRTIFRRDTDGTVSYSFSKDSSTPSPPFPGTGEFTNPIGIGFLPSGRIVVSSFPDGRFGEATMLFTDWQIFAPSNQDQLLAADIVAIHEDSLWVFTSFANARRVLKVERGGGFEEVASISGSGGGTYGDMILAIAATKVGTAGNLLLVAHGSLWEINPSTKELEELLGGFVSANGLAYGGDGELYLLDGGDSGTAIVYRIEPDFSP